MLRDIGDSYISSWKKEIFTHANSEYVNLMIPLISTCSDNV